MPVNEQFHAARWAKKHSEPKAFRRPAYVRMYPGLRVYYMVWGHQNHIQYVLNGRDRTNDPYWRNLFPGITVEVIETTNGSYLVNQHVETLNGKKVRRK